MIRLGTLLCFLVIPMTAAGQPSPAPAFERVAWNFGAVLPEHRVDPGIPLRFEVPRAVFSLSARRLEPSPVLESRGVALPLPRADQRVGYSLPLRFHVPAAFEMPAFTQTPSPAPRRPAAVEYSRGYEIRQRIHVVASVATLPLVGAEIVLGQKLYDGNAGSGARSAHGAVAGGIAALFGINTVTGAWNLWEGRTNPAGRARRIVHGLLMLAADAGFVATASLAPESEEGEISGNRGQHRAVALTSIGLAATSYLIMLFGR